MSDRDKALILLIVFIFVLSFARLSIENVANNTNATLMELRELTDYYKKERSKRDQSVLGDIEKSFDETWSELNRNAKPRPVHWIRNGKMYVDHFLIYRK